MPLLSLTIFLPVYVGNSTNMTSGSPSISLFKIFLTVPMVLFVRPSFTSILCVNTTLQFGPSLVLCCVFWNSLFFIFLDYLISEDPLNYLASYTLCSPT